MLVCQCNVITDREIRGVIRQILMADPWALIVPARVYRELEKRCKCSGCVPNVVDLIQTVTAEYHREMAAAVPEAVVPTVAAPPARRKRGASHARRSAGHRAA